MAQRTTKGAFTTQHSYSDISRSDVKGMLFLLLSIRASLQLHGAGEDCAAILKECIASFQQRYDLSDDDMTEAIVWTETSFNALLRLLDYLRAEASDQFNDHRCAQQIALCIDRLMEERRYLL
jgi:hypothetical protein